jgi:hypothetical protein
VCPADLWCVCPLRVPEEVICDVIFLMRVSFSSVLILCARDGKGNTALHYSLEMDDLQVSSSSSMMHGVCLSAMCLTVLAL